MTAPRGAGLLDVEMARRRILAAMRATPVETVSLAEAWNRVAAEDVLARVTQPPQDVSAMDGYAVQAAAATGWLPVIGEAAAGHPFAAPLAPGQAVRLFTGSVIPDGADAVAVQEDAERDADQVRFTAAPAPGRHIRRAGQDFRRGEVLLPAGTRLGARAIGLAAAANQPWLAVHRRPVVAIQATGDEVVLPGQDIPAGGIVSSNAHALAALVQAAGARPLMLPVAADERGAVAAIAGRARGCDLLVTIGGASVGDHDLIRSGLAEAGFELDFWKIAMRPGKPLIFGRLGDIPVLGLPGNPVSAFVCALLFLLPALDRLSGGPGDPPARTDATLASALPRNDEREDHVRATLREADGKLVVSADARQDSSLLRQLTRSNCLIHRAPHEPARAPGSLVSVIRLDLPGF